MKTMLFLVLLVVSFTINAQNYNHDYSNMTNQEMYAHQAQDNRVRQQGYNEAYDDIIYEKNRVIDQINRKIRSDNLFRPLEERRPTLRRY